MSNIRKNIDVRKLAKAIASSGIDTRHWVSYGTVGLVDSNNEINYTDKAAIYIGPQGVEVDVILEPSGIPVVCKYNGIQGGANTVFLSPINPGDQVVVVIPEGNPTIPPVIVGIINSDYTKVPIGDDNLPIFKNDRVMLYSMEQPVEIHANTIKLGDDTASQPFVLGTAYKADQEKLYQALIDHQHVSAVGPTSPATLPVGPDGPPITVWLLLKQNLANLLSGIIKGK